MIEDPCKYSNYGYTKENNGWTRFKIIKEKQHICALGTNILEGQNQKQYCKNDRSCEVKSFHRKYLKYTCECSTFFFVKLEFGDFLELSQNLGKEFSESKTTLDLRFQFSFVVIFFDFCVFFFRIKRFYFFKFGSYFFF